MRIEDLNSQPVLLFPKPKDEVRFFDKDHVWVNGRQYISLKRVGEMLKEKRTTNADRIRSMTDEELAGWLAKFTDCGECPVWGGFPHCTTSEESCACRWHEWLKKEGEE